VAAAEAGVGPLVTSHAYLSLFRTQVTDPRGYVTTTSFQAFDQPATDAPRLIQSPAGVSTTIARDLFGKPTSLTRSGPWEGGTLSAVRRYVYDGHERLCKTHDPEAGWTVMDYDASNNLAWTTTGANLPSLTDCQRDSVAVGDRVGSACVSFPVKEAIQKQNFRWIVDGLGRCRIAGQFV